MLVNNYNVGLTVVFVAIFSLTELLACVELSNFYVHDAEYHAQHPSRVLHTTGRQHRIVSKKVACHYTHSSDDWKCSYLRHDEHYLAFFSATL